MSDEIKTPPPTPEFGAYDYTQYQDEQGHYRIPSLQEELSALFKPTRDTGKWLWNQATKPESWTRQRLADSRRFLVEKGDDVAKLVQDPHAGLDKFTSAAASTRDFWNFISQSPVVPMPPGALKQHPTLANVLQATPRSEPLPRAFILQNELADADFRRAHAAFVKKYPTFDLRPLPQTEDFNDLGTPSDTRAYYTALANHKQVFQQMVGLEQAYHRRAHDTLSLGNVLADGSVVAVGARYAKEQGLKVVGHVDDALDAIVSFVARKKVDVPEIASFAVTAIGACVGAYGLRWYQCRHDFKTMQLEIEALDRQTSPAFRL